jgi:hypothetical protein
MGLFIQYISLPPLDDLSLLTGQQHGTALDPTKVGGGGI